MTYEKPRLIVLQSTPPMQRRASWTVASFIQEASKINDNIHGERSILLQTGILHDKPSSVLIWLCGTSRQGSLDLDEAGETLQAYLESGYGEIIRPLQLSFRETNGSRSFVLVANILKPCIAACLDGNDDEVGREAQASETWGMAPIFQQFNDKKPDLNEPHCQLLSHPASAIGGRSFRIASLLAVFVLIAVFLLSKESSSSMPPIDHHHAHHSHDHAHHSPDYIRYPTGDSVGPQYQLRIQWHNASDWMHSHPHRNGEWAFRMDDQALVPAHLYDEEEDRYQQWFRLRYPHMTQVADRGDYIRPAWLGSRSVAIEWDSTFHDAHCILALRRYFKAKETGRHVCARDINPGHIKHCLDKLDAVHFKPGEMTRHEPKQYMYWQTKVCFGEEED